MRISLLTSAATVAVAAVLAAGCGGSSGGGSSSAASAVSGAQVVEIDVASSGFAFTTSTATAKAGPVELKSKNPQAVSHDISLKGNGVSVQGSMVANGGVSTVTVANLKPGTYTFYCSVPGHEQAGMKGTLTVS
jgi:uncharacterized cupredoxin-like copper-binding protein